MDGSRSYAKGNFGTGVAGFKKGSARSAIPPLWRKFGDTRKTTPQLAKGKACFYQNPKPEFMGANGRALSLIHISEPTRPY